ncbi:MAG TPA: TetR/AcrR family transcriptional regulator [Steroidobacter sp.]|uniref:TetR/AcrR family transcriptional regulator n=1 Tax=Steroidobacter sp. TaxID=1978227 RepID=UPI002EDA5C4B
MAGRQARKSNPQRASGPALWASVGARVRDRERKRDAVIMTAARAFRERGYHNTSLDDIASELNVTKPTVYHYVENKEQLLFECFRSGLALIMNGIEEQRESTATGRERLAAVIARYAEAITSDFGWCMVQAENQDLSPTMSRKVKALKSEIDQGLRSLIRAGVADGSIRPCDEKMTAFALAGALNWIAHWYRSDDKLAASEIAQRFIELFELGLQPR